MDPFIESQVWGDFHHHFIGELHNSLVPRVRPRYVVRVEKRVYLEHEPDEQPDFIRPDVTALESEGMRSPSEVGAATAITATASPVVLTLPMPERKREAFLTISERETMEMVTIIEVLSPGNKRPGSDGRREYLSKREVALQSATHLVELDLLRRGERLLTIEPLPSADYYAFVCRGERRPRAEVYAWTLRHPLPSIPVPLAGNEPDVVLNLQAIFNTVYDRAGYDYSLDYRSPIEPPLEGEDLDRAQQLL
jgi:hypothetical protein